MNDFFTIVKECVFQENEKRSKFISYSFSVESIEDIKAKLETIKATHWSAKHHVYAYSLNKNSTEKFSDDGEPSGTAGLPILNAIRSEGLTNILVVVVRYFGGILLGTSGLRKMYSSGAKNVIQNSGKISISLCSKVEIGTNYSNYNSILKKIKNCSGKVLETKFKDKIEIMVAIPKENFENFSKDTDKIGLNDTYINFIEDDYFKL